MSETLQEYIVRIRYEQDNASRSSMLSGISDTLGSLTKITAVGLGMAAVVAKTTHKIADGINSLYLTSKNMGGGTIRAFKSITEAAEDVGSSVEGMTSSLAALNKFTKTMGPGAQRYISQLAGKEYKEGMSAPDSMMAIAKNVGTLKEQGMTQEQFHASTEVAGIGFNESQAMWDNNKEFLEQQKKHSDTIGTGLDKMAPKIHGSMEQFGIDVDKLESTLATTMGDSFQKVIDLELKGFETAIGAFADNSNNIKNVLDGTMKVLSGDFSGLSGSLKDLAVPLNFIKDHFDGFLNVLGIIGTALTALTIAKGIGNLAGVATGALAAPIAGVVVAGAAVYGAASWINEKTGLSDKIADKAMDWFHPNPEVVHESPFTEFKHMFVRGKDKDIKDRAALGMNTFQALGMTHNEAAGVMGSLSRETSGLNPFQKGDKNKSGEYKAYGIQQWHADRRANYTKQFGHTMESVGDQKQAYAEQLAFIDWERKNDPYEKNQWAKVQSQKDDPYAKGAAYSQYMVRPGDIEREKKARGGAAEGYAKEFNSNINITVNGAKDPREVAEEIQKLQHQETQKQVRYNQMAHQ